MTLKMWDLVMYCYCLYFCRVEVEMQSKTLEKIVNGFKTAGIIITPIYGLVYIAKEFSSISWADFTSNLVHLMNLAEKIFIILACLFIIWILHKLAMFGIHKLWPDDYDENGHMRK